jgi:YidC/Oxa1 family membrane protein insertase
MSQDTRVLIAFALSFVMLVLWRVFYVKEPPKPKPAAAEQAQKVTPGMMPGAAAAAGVKPPAGKGGEGRAPSAKTAAASKPAAPEAIPVEQGSSAQEIVVESDLYRVTFSTQGAVVKSWVLKKYKDEQENPLDVINGEACEKLGYPMSLSPAQPQDAALADQLNKAVYVAKPAGTTLQAPAKVEFVYSDGKVRVKKEFDFGEGYEVKAEVSVWNGEHYLPVAVAWPGGFGDQSLTYAQKAAYGQAAYSAAGKIETVSNGKVKEARSIAGPFAFVGLEDRYFAGMYLPETPGGEFAESTALRLTPETWAPPDWKEKEPPKFVRAALVSSMPEALKFRLFVAPKDMDVLRAEYQPLEGLVDFGWFTIFAKPLFLGMRYIYDHWVHNYGWAIIVLTVLINMLMFPLKLKQIRSAQEMQKVGPVVKSIQERYKQYKFNDPRKQRMNQEIMKIYKDHGVNPLGGCLPMALQLPILYGFYRVLELPIELRHAPWIGWVKDLSAPETVHMFGYGVHVLPIVMIIASFFMQKMTPMPTVDPNQQRMMMMMPIFLGVMFYNLASGLVLYFLVASLVGIAQQIFINKTVAAPAPIAISPKAPEAAE